MNTQETTAAPTVGQQRLVRICEGECEEHGEEVQRVHVYHVKKDWGEFDYCPAAIDQDTINGMDVVVDGGEDRRTLQAWNRLWPRTDFKDRETWLAYCRTWWPKTPELVAILDANAQSSHARREPTTDCNGNDQTG